MTRDKIELRIKTLQAKLSTATNVSALASINRTIERLIIMDADDELADATDDKSAANLCN